MMSLEHKKKAAIIIGDYYISDPIKEQEYDVYYYPENVTEWELAEELSTLVQFYDVLDYPTGWPPHLRKEKVIEWINGQ